LIVPLVGGEESTHRLLVLATQKLSPATNPTPTLKMKTDNWLLRESTTRVTDNRAKWREEYELYLINKSYADFGDYLTRNIGRYRPIDWNWVCGTSLDIVTITVLILFALFWITLWKTSQLFL